jgi:hypothetical protein
MQTRNSRLVVLLVFAGILVVAALMSPGDRTRRLGPPKPAQGHNEMPYIMSQTFIKKQLHVPSTAEFPTLRLNSDDVDVVQLPDGSYRVKAWVKDEGYFGLKVRHYWSCQLKQVSTTTWILSGFCGILPLRGALLPP